MKTLDDIKHRIKNIPRRKYALDFKTRCKHSRGKLKGKMLGCQKIKEGMSHDPDKTKEYKFVEKEGFDPMPYLHLVPRSKVNNNVTSQKSR